MALRRLHRHGVHSARLGALQQLRWESVGAGPSSAGEGDLGEAEEEGAHVRGQLLRHSHHYQQGMLQLSNLHYRNKHTKRTKRSLERVEQSPTVGIRPSLAHWLRAQCGIGLDESALLVADGRLMLDGKKIKHARELEKVQPYGVWREVAAGLEVVTVYGERVSVFNRPRHREYYRLCLPRGTAAFEDRAPVAKPHAYKAIANYVPVESPRTIAPRHHNSMKIDTLVIATNDHKISTSMVVPLEFMVVCHPGMPEESFVTLVKQTRASCAAEAAKLDMLYGDSEAYRALTRPGLVHVDYQRRIFTVASMRTDHRPVLVALRDAVALHCVMCRFGPFVLTPSELACLLHLTGTESEHACGVLTKIKPPGSFTTASGVSESGQLMHAQRCNEAEVQQIMELEHCNKIFGVVARLRAAVDDGEEDAGLQQGDI